MLILCSIIYGPNGHEYDDLCGLSQTMYNQSMFLHLPELATNFIPCHSLCLALPNVNLNLFGILSWQVKRRNSEESSTQWTTGIAEIQLPIEYAQFLFLLHRIKLFSIARLLYLQHNHVYNHMEKERNCYSHVPWWRRTISSAGLCWDSLFL
jgi:hypothetical protein